MKKGSKKEKSPTASALHCGTVSKREAVGLIGGGCQHVHSTPLGDRDPGVKQTTDALQSNTVPSYNWELDAQSTELKLASSVDRQSLIQQILVRAGIEGKRFLREKVESVMEEILTNALYHAYRDAHGKEKYARRSRVTLGSSEILTIRFRASDNGIFLSVSDQAGSLGFDEVAASLFRCYESSTQIQTKEGGAGLGTYMIFDAVTHLKFVATSGKSTVVSCWISDQRSYDPENFSFNFFTGGRPR